MEPKDAMPWVGLYICAASLVCILAMAADVFHGFRQGKLWFPCRFFTLNAVSVTVMAVAMKLPVDLSAEKNAECDVRQVGIFFLVTMVANFLPSLGLMGDKELLINIIAFGILLITTLVNEWIWVFSNIFVGEYFFGILMLPCLLAFSVALTVPASRRNLELQYKELHYELASELASYRQGVNFSSKELVHYVKMYWMMAETGNPQFTIACSQISPSFGVVCSLIVTFTISFLFDYRSITDYRGKSNYKWSIQIIFLLQSFGILVGCIAPIFRFFTVISYFKPSKKWSKNNLNVFKVEKEWTERLQQWKRSHVHSYIPGRNCKKVFHIIKNLILNISIALQIVAAIICKTGCLIPRCFLILSSYCCGYFCQPLLRKFEFGSEASNDFVSKDEVKKYNKYVLLVEEDAKLSKRILKNILRSITKLIRVSAEKEPRNLMKLLYKSKGFNGVVEFDDDEVPPLCPEEAQNCWSLVAVTLTAIAIALPNISNNHVKELLASMQDGLKIVRHIEETLNEDADLEDARNAARRLWTEVEVYSTWLEIDIQRQTRKGKTSKDILQWLGNEAEKEIESSKRGSENHSLHNFIASSSMYRISQTIQLHGNKQENWPNDAELFEWISTIIADVLCACFTNLPCVIKMKCHHDAIEKRGDNIRIAAKLLGKSKKILKILEERELPNLDMDSMAYIDKWKALPNSQILNHCTSSTSVQLTSSSSNASLIVTVV